jgi:prolyl-tRNA synthetase
MIARASELFLPTLREPPADADAASHKLLVRGGFIRQVGAGLWTFLPLGWRVHQKVVQIIREEMNAIGGQEMLCPVLTPAELWETSGRIVIPAVFKLQDQTGRRFVLALSHEETMTFHAKELQSYKQLPQTWYHFSTKERDEPRPRGGLLRVREFIMKDSYSFDRDEAGLDRSFDRHKQAYDRIFERCGLEVYFVEAESGIMGGRESSGYLAPTGSGENELLRCENGDYFADVEAARGTPRAPEFPDPLSAPEEVATPGVATIEELAEFLGIDPAATSKAMPVVSAGRVVLALVRGDDRLSEEKLTTTLGAAFRPATEEELRSTFGAGGGSLGPVGVQVEVIADETLREGQFVAGANRDGWHLRGVEAGRDYQPRFADIRQAHAGDACPKCGGQLVSQTAIELGHIFKLGTFYSEPFGAMYLDEDGRERPIVMGSYGVGPARTIAAIVEQHHDDQGIAWPPSVAPYDAHVVALPGLDEQANEAAEALSGAGLDVILDDRDQRAGEKFADADLIGCPIRVTVGKKTLDDGAVDVRERATGEETRVSIPDLPGRLASV